MFIAGCIGLCLLVCMPLYLIFQKSNRGLSLCFRALGSCCALVMALTAAIKLEPACWVCVLALTFHTAAGVLMELHFHTGLGLALCGHVCTMAFLLNRYPLSGTHLICLLCLLAVGAFLFWKWRGKMKKNLPLLAVYGGVLCCMAACALAGGPSEWSLCGILTACSGALWVMSDGMHLAQLLFPSGRLISWLICALCYGAQLLLAMACLL